MAGTAVVFRVCRAATAATSMLTSTVAASTATGGVPRPAAATPPGTALSVPATASIGPTSTTRGTGVLFVAFGMNRGGLWNGVDSLTL